jgi:hypothetical protein
VIAGRRLPWTVPLALAAAALLLVCGRFLFEARGAVVAAQAALGKGDQVEATRCYLDALRAYVPGSPFERQALDGLAVLAATAARDGDPAGERRALEAVRAGLRGTRSIYTPYRTRLGDADTRLAALDADVAFPPTDPRTIVIQRGGYPLARFTQVRGPAVAFTLIAFLGFATWIGALLLLIRRGVDRDPRSGRGTTGVARGLLPVLLPLLFVVGFALFLVGLRLA